MVSDLSHLENRVSALDNVLLQIRELLSQIVSRSKQDLHEKDNLENHSISLHQTCYRCNPDGTPIKVIRGSENAIVFLAERVDKIEQLVSIIDDKVFKRPVLERANPISLDVDDLMESVEELKAEVMGLDYNHDKMVNRVNDLEDYVFKLESHMNSVVKGCQVFPGFKKKMKKPKDSLTSSSYSD